MPRMDAVRWDRFRQLRNRKDDGKLSTVEARELAELISAIEADEGDTLRPSTEALRRERLRMARRNRTLRNIAARQDAITARLRAVLAEADAECEAIEKDLARAVSPQR